MELELHRVRLTKKATLGSLFVNGEYECVTLEDIVRIDDPSTTQDEGKKVFGETAIPAGRYRVIINMSPKFGKLMMRVLKVDGFDGILIHSGNTPEDSLGCVLVGDEIDNDSHIHGGSKALPRLFNKVQDAIKRKEEVWITITNDFLASAAA